MSCNAHIGDRVRLYLNRSWFSPNKNSWTNKLQGKLVEAINDHVIILEEDTRQTVRVDCWTILDMKLLDDEEGDTTMYECEDKMVSHPDHYMSKTGMEVINVIESFTSDLNGIEATDTGNIIKYICRWKNKNGLQDLKKARWYLEHLINHVEKYEAGNEMDEKLDELYNGLDLGDYEKANHKVTIKKENK